VQQSPKPIEVALEDIPKRFLRNSMEVNWEAVQECLGILDDDTLKEVLLFLYRLDWQVSYQVNATLLHMAIPVSLGQKAPLPMEPPPRSQAAWLAADMYCEGCPGGEYIEYGDGFSYPLCGNLGRLERYSDCLKYRENVLENQLTPEEVETHYQQVVADFEELRNAFYGQRDDPDQPAPGPGSVDTNLSDDRGDSAEPGGSDGGGDLQGGTGPGADG